MSPETTLAELDRVGKRFDAAASGAVEPLRDVSLEVATGETVAIVGPSGSGKTTLLQLLGGLTRPTSGAVRLLGKDLGQLDDRELARVRNEKIGFVFQLHHLLPQCSVLENVLVPTLVRHRRTPPDRMERARELLDAIGLAERRDHRPAELSGGECQRVAVARALINDPVLLLADEPTGALDSATATHLGDLLLELNRERGVTLVTVTHWTELAHRMGRVLRLDGGALVQEGVAP